MQQTNMDTDLIKSVCHCIEILVGDNKHDVLVSSSATRTDAFLAHLKNNISLVTSELDRHPKLQSHLKVYEKYLFSENDRYSEWNFVTWCLILLTVLYDSLSSETDGKETHIFTASPVLSISQQKTVEKCIQFIVALGFLPNLLPGLGVSLKNRAKYANIVECIGRDVCPRTKYKSLVMSLSVLLRCTSHILLQSVIITHHAGDLLAALFQLCYAPIKKLKNLKDEGPHKSCEQAAGVHHKKFHTKNLADLLKDTWDHLLWNEEQLIEEMWEDRHYFLPHLKRLLQLICPQVLIWELFLLQGMQQKSVKGKQAKPPLWLKKLCTQILTEQLVKPEGLKLFICTLLDRTTDADLKTGTVDKGKIEAIARLISSNPFEHMPFEDYVKDISPQVIKLLHLKENQMESILVCVASSIVLQFMEVDRSISVKYIFRSIFREFWVCLDSAEISKCEEGACLITEEALITCIEDTYQIFVQNRVPTQQNAFEILLPFYHLLFIMFVETQNGISFLRSKLKELLISLLNSHATDDALMLLRFATFEDVKFPPVQYATNLKCVLGDSGGILFIKDSKSPDHLLEEIGKKCRTIITILDEVSNKKLKVSYFLYLLKRLTDLSVSDATTDEEHCSQELKNNICLLQLLQEMCETIGEDLVEDTVEAVHFIKLALDKAVMSKNAEGNQQQLFGLETVVMSVVILSTIVEYKNQLSSLHWKALKECLPSLENLAADLKDVISNSMYENLIIAIATHGAGTTVKSTKGVPSAKKINPFGTECSAKVTNIKESTANENSNIASQKMTHEEEEKINSHGSLDDMSYCKPNDHVVGEMLPLEKSTSVSEVGDSSGLDHLKKSPSHSDKGFYSTASVYQDDSRDYESALRDVSDPLLPVRGHGLIALARLIEKKNMNALDQKESLLKIFVENLRDEDSYIYLPSIKGLSALADVSTDLVLPAVLDKFCNTDTNCEVILKLGEVLLKICKTLGEMTVKYRNDFIHAYLCGARHSRPEIRASSLSNLGEVCKCLKFSLLTHLQEILVCVLSLLKTDEDVEVRRSAALVITLLLRGAGRDSLVVLENEMKELHHVLRHVYHYEKDDVLKLHAQLALEEINFIMKEILSERSQLTKEIRILDPF